MTEKAGDLSCVCMRSKGSLLQFLAKGFQLLLPQQVHSHAMLNA